MDVVRVLCVDDEPQVLQGLALSLRRGYDVVSASNGAEGLSALRERGPFAVILSDMRMPGMDGAAFLERARELAPDATRMLLTGHADMQAAIAAVNRGQIFRFLAKPCAPDELRAAFDAANRQHQLVTAERVLLEQTLLGCIKTLTEVLSITSPLVFGRATRIRQLATELVERTACSNRWVVEAAAMLSQLGYIAVPDEVARKEQAGEPMSAEERAMIGRTNGVTESLLANIPRLEPVRQILAACSGSPPARLSKTTENLALETAILRTAMDFDELESRGMSAQIALETMRGREGLYRADVLEKFITLKGAPPSGLEVREIALSGLREGMVFADDVRTNAGLLLVARGFRVTASFIERARNFSRGSVKEPLRVIVGGE